MDPSAKSYFRNNRSSRLVLTMTALALLAAGALLPPAPPTVAAQDAPVKEDWALQHQEILDHAEAELLVRHGSIDNLGFGWPKGFDPFSGTATPVHPFPWRANPKAAAGTDRILVVSSYNGNPPGGTDGYTFSTRRPDNNPTPIPITFTPPKFPIHSAVLQVFVDDFQAPVWGSRFQVTMNGWRVPEMEAMLNALNQSGPIGKLVTYQLPSQVVETLKTGKLTILVDDPTTGAGDGYAFDFFRLLVNPRGGKYQGTLTGRVTSLENGKPIEGGTVSAGGVVKTKTDADGRYALRGVPAGLATLTFSARGFERKTSTIDLLAGKAQQVDAQLKAVQLETFLQDEAASQPRLVVPVTEPVPPKEPVKTPELPKEPVHIPTASKVTVLDAQRALKMAEKLLPVQMNLDVDGDGQVTARDAVLLLQRALEQARKK